MKKNILTGVLCLLLVGAGIWIYMLYDDADGYGAYIENGSEETFLSFKVKTEEMSEALKTAVVSNDESFAAKKLALVSKLAGEAARSITSLPINHNISAEAVQFLCTAEDFSYSVLCSLLSGGELTEENKSALEAMSKSCEALSEDINAFHEAREKDFLWYDEDYEFISSKAGRFDDMFAKFLQSIENAPENNYDGKYSAHVINKESGNTENDGKAVAYEFSENMPQTINLSMEQAAQKAREYTEQNGVSDLRETDRQTYSNTAVFTYAYEKNGVAYYPDSILVQVSLEDGSIMGYEASKYYENHKSRELSSPRLSAKEAAASVSGKLEITETTLAVMESDGGYETMCYEYKCKKDDETYVVVIDANSGKELDIYIKKGE